MVVFNFFCCLGMCDNFSMKPWLSGNRNTEQASLWLFVVLLLQPRVIGMWQPLHWHSFFLLSLFLHLSDRVLIYSLGGPWTQDLPASASQALGLQVSATTPGCILAFWNNFCIYHDANSKVTSFHIMLQNHLLRSSWFYFGLLYSHTVNFQQRCQGNLNRRNNGLEMYFC